MSKKKSGPWSFLTSVKLTLVLLALIIILAIVGTLVPQREAAFELSGRLSPTLWNFLSKAQIFDLYHSIWFFALMGLFALNLMVCSIDRFPAAWRRFRRRPQPDDPEVFAQVPFDQILRTSRSQELRSRKLKACCKSVWGARRAPRLPMPFILQPAKGALVIWGSTLFT